MDDIDPDLANLLENIEKAEVKESEVKKPEMKVKTAKDEVEVTEVEHEEIDKTEVDSGLSDNKIVDFNSLDDEDEEDDDEDEGIIDTEIVSELDKDKSDIERSVVGLFKQHCSSAQAMLNEADQDRKRIDDVIAIILPKIESNDYRGTDIQALASLLQTKTEVSKNRSSHMDSIAKLFAALKNNDSVGIGSKANTGDDDISKEELEKLLSKKNK